MTGTFSIRHATVELTRIEEAIQKGLFATANAAHAVKDLTSLPVDGPERRSRSLAELTLTPYGPPSITRCSAMRRQSSRGTRSRSVARRGVGSRSRRHPA